NKPLYSFELFLMTPRLRGWCRRSPNVKIDGEATDSGRGKRACRVVGARKQARYARSRYAKVMAIQSSRTPVAYRRSTPAIRPLRRSAQDLPCRNNEYCDRSSERGFRLRRHTTRSDAARCYYQTACSASFG